ncbi:acyltransferase [Sutcliffiella sp. NPDC057660]|uniref:acyltransferase n=1 Tax=Sutcliffiella sp. NPDC057660 TaxID=3346199 RepID=UPI003696F1FC
MAKRIVYLDWLRVIATVMVVVIHISAGMISINYFDGRSSWLATNFYEAISRMSVPLFVMISGALLLNNQREIKYRSFLNKTLSKIFIPLLGWSIIYYMYQVYVANWYANFSVKEFFQLFLANNISVHFWFMYMILGLYLTVPVIKIYIRGAEKKDLQYFLLLWLYASVLVKFTKFYFGYSLNLELFHVTNYIGYFILGYYLSTLQLKKAYIKEAFIIMFIGMSATFLLTYFSTVNNNGQLQEFWYEYLSPNVLLSAVGSFWLIKGIASTLKKQTLPLGLNLISTFSFGIYLVHMLVIMVFADSVIPFLRNTFHSAVSVPLITIFVLIVSVIITYVFSKIPVIKRFVP